MKVTNISFALGIPEIKVEKLGRPILIKGSMGLWEWAGRWD